MLIPLICKQCGGKLEVEDTTISLTGESFIVLSNQNFECPHCGTKYSSGETSKYVLASSGGVAVGGISVGGEIKGKIIIGNAVTDINPSSKVKTQTKRWWEFWK
jgi:transcription elongation factor Elf1